MRKRRPLLIVSTILFVLAAACVSVFFLLGFRAYYVQSPSMGRTAPVGSLVVVHSQPEYRVGDAITFRTQSGHVFTHRIVASGSHGFTTRGDANTSDDGWRVKPAQVIGKVRAVIPAGGYFLHGLPIFLIVLLIAWLIAGRVDSRWHRPIMLVGASLGFAIASWIVRPWLGVVEVGRTQTEHGAAIRAASTGLFSIRLEPQYGRGVHLVYGQHGTAYANTANTDGWYIFTPHLALSWWGWVLLVLFCLSPLLFTLWWTLRDEHQDSEAAASEPQPEQRPSPGTSRTTRVTAAGATAAFVLLGLALTPVLATPNTQAGWSAQVSNTNSELKMARYFTCRSAATTTSGAVWAASLGGTEGGANLIDGSNNSTWSGERGSVPIPDSACQGDNVGALYFNGQNTCLITPAPSPYESQPMSVELWFRTTDAQRARLFAVTDSTSLTSDFNDMYDHLFWMSSSGQVHFRLQPSVLSPTQTLSTPNSLADGKWHQIVATVSNVQGVGTVLYVDGQKVASNGDMTQGHWYSQPYFKIGCGNYLGLNMPGDSWLPGGYSYFKGDLEFVSVYNRALSAEEVKGHYQARTPGGQATTVSGTN